MRMHRGSSKEGSGPIRPSEDLPLSASHRPQVRARVVVIRAAAAQPQEFLLDSGATVRDALHAAGLFPEASSAWVGGTPVPLDRPVADGETIEVLRTFSGG